MFTKTFFKLFPPPRFLDIPYSGLDISDDALRCIDFIHHPRHLSIHKNGMKSLPPGIIESGNIRNREKLIEFLIYFSLILFLIIHKKKRDLPVYQWRRES